MADKRILMVEDDADVGFLLVHALRSEGYTVDLARTRADAREHLNAQEYALVIADWRLPDGDGTLIADAGRQLGAKTIVMSGYLLQMPRHRVERHEALMKPLRPSEVVAAVVRSIGMSGGR